MAHLDVTTPEEQLLALAEAEDPRNRVNVHATEALRVITGGRPADVDKLVITDLFADWLIARGLMTRHSTWQADVFSPTGDGRAALLAVRHTTGTSVGDRSHYPTRKTVTSGGADLREWACETCGDPEPAPWPCPHAVLYWPDFPLAVGGHAIDPERIAALVRAGDDDSGLYDRLVVAVGPDDAVSLWGAACAILANDRAAVSPPETSSAADDGVTSEVRFTLRVTLGTEGVNLNDPLDRAAAISTFAAALRRHEVHADVAGRDGAKVHATLDIVTAVS